MSSVWEAREAAVNAPTRRSGTKISYIETGRSAVKRKDRGKAEGEQVQVDPRKKGASAYCSSGSIPSFCATIDPPKVISNSKI